MTLAHQLPAFALAAGMTFCAAYIRGLTGFGMAIILVPLLGLIMPPTEAVILGIILQLLIAPVGIRVIYADAERRSALSIAAIAMLMTPCGLWLLGQTAPDVARLLIALIAIGAFLLVLLPPRADHVPGRAMTAAVGAMSGILTGFAAMPGPPVIPYYLMRGLPPATARASMMMVFFATAIAGTLSAWALGKLTVALWLWGAALFIPMWLGNHFGARAFGKVSPTVWRGMVAAILGIAGFSALWRLFA